MLFSIIRYLAVLVLLIVLPACAINAPKQKYEPIQVTSIPEVRWAAVQVYFEPLPRNIEFDIEEKPVVPRRRELHERFVALGTPAELQCLTQAIYFESKSEPEVGKAGVGYAVLNRTGHSYYPSTICGVVHARRPGGRCEFDWVCSGARNMPNQKQRAEAERMAKLVIAKQVPNPIGNSIFFRSTRLGYIPYGKFYARIHGHNFFEGRRKA